MDILALLIITFHEARLRSIFEASWTVPDPISPEYYD
jgi:hypothetical protein